MTVTTADIERCAARAKAEIAALAACAPAHADMIAAAVLARLHRNLGAGGTGGRTMPTQGAAAPRRRARAAS